MAAGSGNDALVGLCPERHAITGERILISMMPPQWMPRYQIQLVPEEVEGDVSVFAPLHDWLDSSSVSESADFYRPYAEDLRRVLLRSAGILAIGRWRKSMLPS